VNDRQTLLVRQMLEQLADVVPRLRGFVVGGGEQFLMIVERDVQRLTTCVGAEEVHQLVARDRVQPRRQRLIGPIGVSRVMYRQQNFLDQVFDIVETMRNALSQIAAQMPCESLQKAVIRVLIACKSADEQRFQPAFRIVRHGSCRGGTTGRNFARRCASERRAAFCIGRYTVSEAVMRCNDAVLVHVRRFPRAFR